MKSASVSSDFRVAMIFVIALALAPPLPRPEVCVSKSWMVIGRMPERDRTAPPGLAIATLRSLNSG